MTDFFCGLELGSPDLPILRKKREDRRDLDVFDARTTITIPQEFGRDALRFEREPSSRASDVKLLHVALSVSLTSDTKEECHRLSKDQFARQTVRYEELKDCHDPAKVN